MNYLLGYVPTMSMADAAQLWAGNFLGFGSDLADNTKRAYRGAITNHLLSTELAALTLEQANKPSIWQTHLQGVADNYGVCAAKQLKAVLSAIFQAAARDDALPRNPIKLTPSPKIGRENKSLREPGRAFSTGELTLLFQIVDNDSELRANDMPALLRFYLITGARCLEVLNLKWDDVDLSRHTIHIQGTKSARADRVIPILPGLTGMLQHRNNSDGTAYVFPRHRAGSTVPDGARRDEHEVRKLAKRAFTQAGVPWATIHTFRTTCATTLVQQGKPINVAAAYLGDSVPTFLASYVSDKLSPATMAAELATTTFL
jgi:integrase